MLSISVNTAVRLYILSIINSLILSSMRIFYPNAVGSSTVLAHETQKELLQSH